MREALGDEPTTAPDIINAEVQHSRRRLEARMDLSAKRCREAEELACALLTTDGRLSRAPALRVPVTTV